MVVVIGMQLLPPRPLERLQLRIERLRPIALAVGLAAVILSSAPPCRARACRRSSTSSSEGRVTDHRDDSEMSRFERARPAPLLAPATPSRAVALVALLLVLFAGGSIRDATAQIDPGIGRDIVDAVGGPTEWVADRLPLQDAQHELTGGLSPDTELAARRLRRPPPSAPRAANGIPPVTPDAFDPPRSAPSRRRSESSASCWSPATRSPPRSTPSSPGAWRPTASRWSASRTSAPGSRTAPSSTGASSRRARSPPSTPTRWSSSSAPTRATRCPGPDGKQVECCGADYAAVFANRVRQVMDTFRQDGAAKVYWLTVMTPRDDDAARVSKVVNAAVKVAAQPWADQVRVVDTVPGVHARASATRTRSTVDGEETIVRESDGIHLNEAGIGDRRRSRARPARARTSRTDSRV